MQSSKENNARDNDEDDDDDDDNDDDDDDDDDDVHCLLNNQRVVYRWFHTQLNLNAKIFSLVKPELIVKPKDAEAVVGGSTFFNCSTSPSSAGIHWFHYPLGATQDRRFVYGYNQFYSHYQGRFHMEKNDATGTYNLVISSVTSDDAGRYKCQDDIGRGDKDSAELTVLDDNPICQSNMKPEGLIGPNICGFKPEVLQLSCAVPYLGNQPPILEWKEVGTESSLTEGVTQNVSNNNAMCYLTMEVNSHVDGSSYQCRTTRSATSQYGCTSDVVKVTGFTQVNFIVISVVVGLSIFIMSGFVFFLLGRFQGRRLKQTESRDNPQPQSTNRQMELHQNQVADKEAMKNLEKENETLLAKIRELEKLWYSTDNKRYRTASELVQTIVTKAAETNKHQITGIAILENNLFVVSKNYPDIEVYDSKTFVFERLIQHLPFTNPLDIASSEEDKCLYIISRRNVESQSEITKHTIGIPGGKYWVTENDNGRLSTYESNLIVCFSTKRIINEYSPDSKIANTVRLSPSAGFNRLWHAIKLTGINFAVSHSKSDDRHRVCVVDISGNVLLSFEELPTFMYRMNVPIYLAEYRDKSLLVADTKNNRVLLLSSNLKFGGVFTESNVNQNPERLCLNETKERAFVAVNSSLYIPEKGNNGRILIYNITNE